MGMPGNLDSYNLYSWNLEARTMDVWSWENWTLVFWSLGPKKLKLNFTVKGAVADYDIFNKRF